MGPYLWRGFSIEKYYVALGQALFGVLTQTEICEEMGTGTAATVAKVWRGETEFKRASKWAAESFATFVLEKVLAAIGENDSFRRLALSELLVMLSGFDLGQNRLIVRLSEITAELEDKFTAEGFETLHSQLLTYRDLARIAQSHARGANKIKNEKTLKQTILPLLKRIDLLLEAGREAGDVGSVLAELTEGDITTLRFLAGASRIVV